MAYRSKKIDTIGKKRIAIGKYYNIEYQINEIADIAELTLSEVKELEKQYRESCPL